MKLTKKEKKILLELGYTEQDLPIIEKVSGDVVVKVRHVATGHAKRISKQKANELLESDKDYLAALGRSIFHWTTTRTLKDNKFTIEFERQK